MENVSRRSLLAAGAALLALQPVQAAKQLLVHQHADPDSVDFWRGIAAEFPVDRSFINLNNGGVSPSPARVMQAVHQALDYTNQAPARNLWQQLEPGSERVRILLAAAFGVLPEEIAITRNASESLQTLQFGIPLKAGDEVITTVYDYPRMITAWEQKARREGIVLRKVQIPMPLMNPMDAVAAIKQAINSKTRIIHISHLCFCTGQIMPVREICSLAREKNVECIVDGAHSFAHFPFQQQDLGCDYFATSLHKWLYAPVGTGMLYVKKEKIGSVWPLMAAGTDMNDNIRKFEEIGTHPAAQHNAITEAIAFSRRITPQIKAKRLRQLHSRWINRLKNDDRVSFTVNIADETQWCGIVVVRLRGFDHGKIGEYLLNKHRIITTPIQYADVDGIRITPNIYIDDSEIDYFADTLLEILENKVPGLLRSDK
jgi:selenocysteine lyase/cysteine desulfurase